MLENTCAETVSEQSDKTQPDPASITAFAERVAASTAHALDLSGDTSARSFFSMVGRVARDRWSEAKSEYANLKQTESKKSDAQPTMVR